MKKKITGFDETGFYEIEIEEEKPREPIEVEHL
jgi:hypothetical protein